MTRHTERGSVGLLVLVLAALVGLIGWNYQRNVAAEQRVFRPYRGYADADLAALVGAYEGEAERTGNRYDKSVTQRVDAHGGTGLLMGNVREFERAQAAARRTRDARENFADARAGLEELKKEQLLRAGERSKLQVFLRRAFTF